MKTPTPFVEWSRDKSRLVPILQSQFPSNFNRYFEPFIGGGELFLATCPQRAFLSGWNARLIRTYTAIRDGVEKVIEYLGEFENNKTCFDLTRRMSLSSRFDSKFTDAEIAAWLIYLNKTCFNGLYRINPHGFFNVRFGNRSNPLICDADNLRACSIALQGVGLDCADFQCALSRAQESDVVYLNPPYMPITATSSCPSYTTRGFSIEDHRRLRDAALDLARRGAHVLVLNSAAPLVYDLYRDPNFEIHKVGSREEVLVISKDTQRTAPPTSDATNRASLHKTENTGPTCDSVVDHDFNHGLDEFGREELAALRKNLSSHSDDWLEHSIGFYETRCMDRNYEWFASLPASRRKQFYQTTPLDRAMLCLLRTEQVRRVQQGLIDMSQHSVEKLRELSRNYLRRFKDNPTETNERLLQMIQSECETRGLQCVGSSQTDGSQLVSTWKAQESRTASKHETTEWPNQRGYR